MSNYINYIRKHYLDKIQPLIGKNVIKVLVGQRRTGKSYLMLQIIDLIKQSEQNANIIYINKEHLDFDRIKSYTDLQAYFDNNFLSDTKNYLFIDEIQEIKDFEKSIRHIYSKNMADIYVTGSNADILSGELASRLSGRYVEIKVFPLSYPEYLEFYRLEDNQKVFLKYLEFGGLPALINVINDDHAKSEFLKGINATILFRDIISRYQIRNISFLQNLIHFLADNTGGIFSSKRISNFLKSQKISVSPNIVLDYTNYLEKAYLIERVLRSDMKGKKIFETGEKIYFEDLGLRNIVSGFNIANIEKLLENIVYLHLCIAGFKVYTGSLGIKEIDFVCEKGGNKIYVQVCYLLSEQSTVEREFGNLLLIKDNYPKYVVSMDELASGKTYEGIFHLNIRDFCKMCLTREF